MSVDVERLHVMMISEGTYPYHWGGVSTWCHLLLSDLPHIDFSLISIIGDPSSKPIFELPKNVVEFRPITLWGVRELLESRANLGLHALLERRVRTDDDTITQQFIPLFRSFLKEIFAYSGDPQYVADLIHKMYRFFMDFDFDSAMRSKAAWECLVEVAQSEFPKAAKLNGYEDARYSLADLTAAMQWLYHWFFVIGEPLPKTDIAHAAMAGLCTLVAVVCKLEHGASYMLTEHGIYLRERYLAESRSAPTLFRKLFSLRFSRLMTLISYALADQIAPCCDYNHRWELRHGAKPEQIHTIYYGVDSVRFTPEHKPFGDPPVVVWVGRIDPLKDLLTLLRAAHVVHQEYPEIEFRLYGGTSPGTESYYEQCLALHEELELQDVVKFGGFRSSPASAFNEADVVILTSVSEAFPFVVLEAMLCEKPVVATAVGGVPEQVEGCGIAVEPRNPEAMAEAILKLMRDPDLCQALGQKAREKAIEQYSVRQSGQTHESVYRKLTSKRQRQNLVARTVEVDASATAPTHSTNGYHDTKVLVANNGKSYASSVTVTRNGANRSYPISNGVTVLDGFTVPAISELDKELNGNGMERTIRHTANGNGNAEVSMYDVIRTDGNGSAGTNGNHKLPTNGNGSSAANGNGNETSNGNKSSSSDGRPKWSPSDYKTSHVNNTYRANASALRDFDNGNGEWVIDHDRAIDALALETSHQVATPIDSLEVTALLESMGITDEVARQRYGAPHAFDLGYAVYSRLRSNHSSADIIENVFEPRLTRREAIHQYLKGPLGLVPPFMLLLMLLIAARSGLFNAEQVLVFSAGLTGSLLVANGFAQGIGRRTAIYLSMRKPRMAGRYLALATITCTIAIIAVSGLIITWLILYRHMNTQYLFTFYVSFVCFTLIWMSAGGLSLVDGVQWLSIGLAVGLLVATLLVFLFSSYTQLSPSFAILAGYLVSVLIIIWALFRRYAKADGDHSPSSDYHFPSISYLFLEGTPYFAYGALYMTLIMMPHFLAWQGALLPGQNAAWRVTSIEVGLTLSMPPIILAYGVAEYALRLFWRIGAVAQSDIDGANVPGFGQRLLQFSSQKRTVYLIVLCATSLITYLLFHAAIEAGLIQQWLNIADTDAMQFIFNASLIAYALLGLGLYNCMFAVTLSTPKVAIVALLCSLATLVTTGYWLGEYYFAYVGISFVIAAAVFALITLSQTARVIRSADFSFASTI